MSYEFRFPDIGEGIAEGTLLEWRCRPGDRVAEGDVVALVETDKVVAEIPSPRSGVVEELSVQEGRAVRVGELLLRIAAEGSTSIVGQLETRDAWTLPPSSEGRPQAAPPPATGRVTATPVARRLAAGRGLDITAIRGSGPEGRVLKQDVLASPDRPGEGAPETTAAVEGLTPLSSTRRAIARAMEESWRIPAALLHEQAEVGELVELRRRLNDEGTGGRLSYLPFFLKVTALALQRYPLLNSHYLPQQEAYRSFPTADIGFALEGPEGLLVPVLRGVEGLSLTQLQEQIDLRRAQAASRSIDLAALRGGSFTVTSYGSIGGTWARPLILPPQVGILGFGRILEMPVAGPGGLAPGSVLPLSLAFDHRLVDGAYAARFVQLVSELLSRPHRLLALMR